MTPQSLLGLDVDEFNAVVAATDQRWGHEHELLRILCVLVDRLTRVCVVGFSGGKAKGGGQPFEYKRPGEQQSRVSQAIRPRDLALRLRG